MKNLKNIVTSPFFIFSTLIFFASFFTNLWDVVAEEWFINQNYPSEGLVIGRIVESRQNGIFSYGGLPGRGYSGQVFNDSMAGRMQSADFQFQAYREGLNFESFTPYKSQIGGQGIIFSLLDKVIPLSPQNKLKLFQLLTSLLTSISLSIIIYWFSAEFGFITGFIVLVSTILSSWLVVFGGKLWWSLWSFFLPMVGIMFLFKEKNITHLNSTTFGLTVFGLVFIKCFISGYEYISTTLIMMLVPFIYYSIFQKIGFKLFLKLSLVSVFSSIIALFISFAILSIQIASIDGSVQNGVQHIIYSLGKRTYGNPNIFPSLYTGSLQANTFDVLKTYFTGAYFSSNQVFTSVFGKIINKIPMVRYSHLVFTFGIASIFLCRLQTKNNITVINDRNRSLLLATWFSLMAPLSWFIIFKAHSYIHVGMNFIVWQMPFTLFGFAICGQLFQIIIEGILEKRKSIPKLRRTGLGK